MLPRKKKREMVFQALYSKGFNPHEREEAIPFLMEHFKTTRKNCHEVLDAADDVAKEQKAIDELIEGSLKDYTLERVGNVERRVLQVLIYELIFKKEIDVVTAASEGQRLAKKFSHESAGQFITAVIHEVAKKCSNESES